MARSTANCRRRARKPTNKAVNTAAKRRFSLNRTVNPSAASSLMGGRKTLG